MINQFQIGNFKAFGDIQSVPLKPITIIFGPNSSGKSSVIHSLLLARHGVDKGNLDATYPSIAGHSVDLGGYRQYVHRRQYKNGVQWSAELPVGALPQNITKDFKAKLLSVHVEIDIKLDDHDKPVPGALPFAKACEYRLDGKPFIKLTCNERGADYAMTLLNRDHPVFEPILQAMLLTSRAHEAMNKKDQDLLYALVDVIVPRIRFKGDSDFLPGIEMDAESLAQMERSAKKGDEGGEFNKLGDLAGTVRLFLPRVLRNFHAGVQEALTKSISCLSYLGPLRSFPPRHTAFVEETALGHSDEGARAWQELASNDKVRDKVNAWLGDEAKLKTPYRLELESFFPQQAIREMAEELQGDAAYWSTKDFLHNLPADSNILTTYLAELSMYDKAEDRAEIDASLKKAMDEHADFETVFKDLIAPRLTELFAQRKSSGASEVRLFDIKKKTPVSHRDVGIGVSQVLPVLVQAYASKNALIAMEQPEIHLHPALQAELGDVFIESALGGQQNRFVLETHSEHLILRILRRIRETSAQKREERPAISPDDIALLYVDGSGEGARVLNLRTDKQGRLLDRCPGGFFEEGFEELF